LSGGDGNDGRDGGPDGDRFAGGPGNDILLAVDAVGTDFIGCGPGRDVAYVDRGDRTFGCERVRRAR
jgi:hypothetical protein